MRRPERDDAPSPGPLSIEPVDATDPDAVFAALLTERDIDDCDGELLTAFRSLHERCDELLGEH